MYHNRNTENFIVPIEDETNSFGMPDNCCDPESFLGIGSKKKKQKALTQTLQNINTPGLTERERLIATLSSDGKLQKRDKKAIKQFEKTQRTIARQDAKVQKQIAKTSNVNQTNPVLDAANPKVTESMATEPGQIGTMAGETTMNAQQAQATGLTGGGGGGIMEDVNEISSSMNPGTNPTVDEQQTPEGAKTLGGVTVGNKKFPIVLIIVAVVVVVGIILLMKKKK